MDKVSWPGFHVFKYHPDFEKPIARPHVDVPFNKFDWGRTMGYEKIFTHVVPLELPTSGGGMYIWDVTAEDLDRDGVDHWLKKLPGLEKEEFKHSIDTMVFHSGRYAHQIMPFERGDDGSWRITLQSHAVLIDNVWNLYW